LFPDRKRVPGRKTKYILAIVYLVHIFAVSKFLQQKRVYEYDCPYAATKPNNSATCRERLPPSSSLSKTYSSPLSNIGRISFYLRLLKVKEELNTLKNSIDLPIATSSSPVIVEEYKPFGKSQEQEGTPSPQWTTLTTVTLRAITFKMFEIFIVQNTGYIYIN
jgi:hypothetical protein